VLMVVWMGTRWVGAKEFESAVPRAGGWGCWSVAMKAVCWVEMKVVLTVAWWVGAKAADLVDLKAV
jgi:hypothetical protein